MKKTVCLFTNWYPTKENPYQGVFFKEQLEILKDEFNFVVIHYKFKHTTFFTKYFIRQINEAEEDIVEFEVCISSILLGARLRVYKWLNRMNEVDSIKGKSLCRAFDKLGKEVNLLYAVSSQSEAGFLHDISRYLGVPYIVSEHGPFPWVGTTLLPYHKQGIESAKKLLLISMDKYRQILMQGVKAPEVSYVGNMVDENKYLLSTGSNDIFTFVAVGANVFYKNYDYLIEIVSKLKEITDKNFRVRIVGYAANRGYSRDIETFEETIEKSGVSDVIELLPSVERDKMSTIYRDADAFIMTSIQEGQPVSAMEAAVCGLPIYATRCGGIEDYVDDDMGRLFGLLESNLFAEELKKLLEGNTVYNHQLIRKKAIELFGVDSFRERMIHVFDEAMIS